MVTDVTLKVRECTDCDREAVVLGGPGAECPHCGVGEIVAYNGRTQTVELPEAVAEQYRDAYESEVVE